MNFLNPLFLLSLLAVAVPLLIHIFSRRRVPEVPFSTLRFLRRSDRRSMKRVNLRRLLLLLLRMLGVMLVALAFARPVMRGGLAALFPVAGSKAVCILLDRSYSMRVEADEGQVFSQAAVRVRQVVDHLGKQDEVALLLFDESQETLYGSERFDRDVLLGSLGEIVPSWRGTDLREAVSAGRAFLRKSRHETKELFIISDFQRSGIGRRTRVPAHPERAFLVPVRPGPGANVSIETVLTPRAALHGGEVARLSILLRNNAEHKKARFPLEIMIDGSRIIEKEIEIPPGGTREESVGFPVEKTGWIEGKVRKRSDRLPADDERYFTLRVREKMNVLLISGDKGFYLEQALCPGGVEGDISLRRKDWADFTSADLDRAEAVVLGPGGGALRRDAGFIERFVRSGGKALVFVLPELEPLVRLLGGASPRIEFRLMETGFLTIEKPHGRPDLLLPFNAADIDALVRVKFRRAAAVTGVPAEAVLLRFDTGTPFIWEKSLGSGHVVFTAIDPVPEAGGLTLSPYFLPLVQQLLLATGPELPPDEGAVVGNAVTWEGPFTAEPLCRMPGGEMLKPRMDGVRRGKGSHPGGGERTLLIPPPESPGFITIIDGQNVAGRVAVNIDSRKESDLDCLGGEEAADSLGLENFLVIEEGDNLAAGIATAREGREISVLLILAAIAVFVLELVIAQRKHDAAEESRDVG